MKRYRKPDERRERELVQAAVLAKRAGRRWFRLALLLGLIALFVVVPISRHFPRLPEVSTATLDPVVAQAIRESLERVRTNPASSEAWGRLATLLMHHEFIEESDTAFAEAEERAPGEARWYYLHALLLMNHEPNTALELLRKSVERAPPPIDMPRLRLAQFLTERHQPKEAEAEFRRLLRDHPRHAAACLGLGRLLHQEGRSAESVPLLQSALVDPRTGKSAHELLASVHWALGQTNEAQNVARKATALAADLPWPDPYWDEAAKLLFGLKHSLDRANALLDSGHADEAVPLLQGVTRDYPKDPEGWYLLGWALNQQRNFNNAEGVLQEHLRLSTNSAKGLVQFGVALLGQRKFAEAIDVLDQARALKPTWREVHSNLGYACVQTGRWSEAEAHYRQALGQDPNYVPSYTALGELLLRRGERAEARRVVEQAARMAPEDSNVQALIKKIIR